MKSLSVNTSGFLVSLLTLVLFAFPVLPFAIRSIAIGLWAASCIFYVIQNKGSIQISRKDIYELVLFTFPFLLLVISLLYSENLKRGGDLIVRILPLILCPILFLFCKKTLTPKLIFWAKCIFVVSSFLVVVYSISQTYIQYDYLNRPFSEKEYKYNGVNPETITKEIDAEIKYRRFKIFVEEKSGTHSTYLGIYIALSLFFIGEILFSKKHSVYLKIAGILIGLTLLGWLGYLSVRAPLLAFLASAFFVLLFNIRNTKILLLSLIGLLGLGAMLYFSVPNLKLRIDEVVENKFNLPKSGTDPLLFNSTNVRLGSLYCSSEIFKEHWAYGVGVGDVQDALNDCYTHKIGAIIYTWDTYNNHNQYLFFATAIGILGVLSFIAMMLYLIFMSIKRRDSAALFFFTSAAILFLTENILVRSDGIMYFAVIGYCIYNFKKELPK